MLPHPNLQPRCRRRHPRPRFEPLGSLCSRLKTPCGYPAQEVPGFPRETPERRFATIIPGVSKSREETVHTGSCRGINKGSLFREDFPERFHQDRIATQPVFLVVVLSPRESRVEMDFSDQRKINCGGKLLSAFPRFPFLGRGMDEDERSVLAGPGGPCRIMGFPKNFQEAAVRYDCRVKIDLDRLGMVAQVMVGWIRVGASRVADTRAEYPIEAPEPGVRAPESAKGKGRGLKKPVTFAFVRHAPSPPSAEELSSLQGLPGELPRGGPGSSSPSRPSPGGPPCRGLP